MIVNCHLLEMNYSSGSNYNELTTATTTATTITMIVLIGIKYFTIYYYHSTI